MAMIGQETNARFLQNNKDIEKYLDGQLLLLRENLANERLKADTIMEGKAQQYTIEIESRVLQKVSQMMDDSNKMREEILNKLVILNTDAENNINNNMNKEDKVMMDTKMTVRDAAMKQWAMNLMEDQHLEWQRLFEEKLTNQESKVTGKFIPGKLNKKEDNNYGSGGGGGVSAA